MITKDLKYFNADLYMPRIQIYTFDVKLHEYEVL